MISAVRSVLHSLRGALRQASRPSAEQLRIIVNRDGSQITLRPEDYDDFDFKNGDKLTIEPQDLAAKLLQTPDGSRHIRIGDGTSIRIPAQYDIAEFKGFKLPAHLVTLTGAGPETLDPIGAAHVTNYKKYMGLEAGMSVLEIGCGMGRDAMQLMGSEPQVGKYVGIDVTRDSIVWCRKNITKRHPNFEFHHFDAEHELYNPLGTKTSLDFRLPAKDRSVDRVFLGSVFTHLFETEVVHYMKEIRRVLKPDGQAYATFFLYSPEIIEAAVRTNRTPFGLRFEHPHGDGCYISNPQYPTGAVAFTDAAMQRMMSTAGVRLTQPYLHGWWSGYYEDAVDGQEVAILTPAI